VADGLSIKISIFLQKLLMIKTLKSILFIGGGNMATAMVGGLIQSGYSPQSIHVLDPDKAQRARLKSELGVQTLAEADATLVKADLVVWAVKPQLFKQAAAPCAPHTAAALHLSVMAGLRSHTIEHALGSARVVRAMPNTPALIGQGMAGLFANSKVSEVDRAWANAVLATTGQTLWVANEVDLDAVTALSGSGPAYVFYVVEAMVQAACDMGLSAAQGQQLALATFAGATALAQSSPDSPAVLRERVTSKGGTTHAAVSVMEAAGVKTALVQAMRAAQGRAAELGDELA
jgi:pyrroline-5-carboxylate reductase